MKLSLTGKRALVTGSNTGVGEAIALRLAEEGCAVGVHGRDAPSTSAIADRIKAAGGSALMLLGDLSREQEAESVAQAVIHAWGGVDILINNAPGAPGTTSMAWQAVSPDLWLDTHSRNVVSAVRLILRFLPGMRDRGWGRMIQIASAAATPPFTMGPDYEAAKAAALNMTVSLAQALRGTGITVNAVSLGAISIPGVEASRLRMLAEENEWRGLSDAEIQLRAVGRVPAIGKPEHIAHVICMLSAEVGSSINGANVRFDGGPVPTSTDRGPLTPCGQIDRPEKCLIAPIDVPGEGGSSE